MSALEVRSAEERDVAGIATVIRETGAELGWPTPTEPGRVEEQVLSALRRCRADSSHLVLVSAGPDEVAGYLSAHWLPNLLLPGPEGYVSELFVRPARRGAGIGSALLAAARRAGETRGCFRLMLLNGRHRESYTRGFYRKAGWTEREQFVSFVLPLMPPPEESGA